MGFERPWRKQARRHILWGRSSARRALTEERRRKGFRPPARRRLARNRDFSLCALAGVGWFEGGRLARTSSVKGLFLGAPGCGMALQNSRPLFCSGRFHRPDTSMRGGRPFRSEFDPATSAPRPSTAHVCRPRERVRSSARRVGGKQPAPRGGGAAALRAREAARRQREARLHPQSNAHQREARARCRGQGGVARVLCTSLVPV